VDGTREGFAAIAPDGTFLGSVMAPRIDRAGYVREGVLRSLHFKGELRDDTIIYSRLPTDPEP
jgi:hypothetical protein